LDHVHVKLLRLPELMRTAAGRRIGAERAAFVDAFMRRMAAECGTGTGEVR
jgi:HD superfamily phosphodiesterase